MQSDPQVHKASALAAEVCDRAGEKVRPEASPFRRLTDRQVSRNRGAQVLEHAPYSVYKILCLNEEDLSGRPTLHGRWLHVDDLYGGEHQYGLWSCNTLAAIDGQKDVVAASRKDCERALDLFA